MALQPAAPSHSSSSSSEKQSSSRRHHRRRDASEADQDVFWYPSLSSPLPDNHTPGMMLLLKKAMNYSVSRGRTRRAYLCWEHVTYISGQSWDRGWGCGYRNFMMICSALVEQHDQPMYFPLLDSPIPPGVRHLQLWLEVSWADGYDVHGASQLKPLVGTSKWIGVSDLYIAFSCRGIPCELVDFNYLQSFGGNEALMNWIKDYFSSPSAQFHQSNATEALMVDNVVLTRKMPIILQDGYHSRTVVGFEQVDSTTIDLLVFDPSRRLRSKVRRAALALFDPSRQEEISEEVLRDAAYFFRYHIHRNVFGRQWQVLHFPMTEPLNEAQMQRRKVVVSSRP
ncbi:DUF1671-domain-containing protein [Hymenopellis radicata]|nr:DUF1671-domain-containing protein [Hymenopellis radicata]